MQLLVLSWGLVTLLVKVLAAVAVALGRVIIIPSVLISDTLRNLVLQERFLLGMNFSSLSRKWSRICKWKCCWSSWSAAPAAAASLNPPAAAMGMPAAGMQLFMSWGAVPDFLAGGCSWPAAEDLLCIIFSSSFFRPANNNINTRQCILRSYIRSSDPSSKPDQLRPEIQKSYISMAPLFCSNSGSQLEGVVQIPRGSMFASAAASAAGGGIIILICMISEITSTNSLHS